MKKTAIAFLALFVLAVIGARADFRSQGGITFVDTEKPEKPKKIDDMFSATRIPNDIDTDEPLEIACDVFAVQDTPDGFIERDVKADWTMMAYVVDPVSGTFDSLDVASGKVRTGDQGIVFFSIELPDAVADAIFTDGFESGDVMAFLVGHARLTGGEKLDAPSFTCDVIERDR